MNAIYLPVPNLPVILLSCLVEEQQQAGRLAAPPELRSQSSDIRNDIFFHESAVIF